MEISQQSKIDDALRLFLNDMVSEVVNKYGDEIVSIALFGSATTFPHFLHLVTSNGSYMGIRTLTLGSGLVCSTKILFTGTLFQ